ncbi:hypothetical protein [Haloarchaeobius sp. HRN-SO-5]|uniref:hypothetical protein n=1 Tax=Haloarchaeobius sp. HRN-SO-5 TaxID=3446118 RepID=UPI003EB9B85D
MVSSSDTSAFLTVPLSVALVAGLVVLTDVTARSVLPLALAFLGTTAWNLAEDVYDLPDGSNWLFYGGLAVAVGITMPIVGQPVQVGVVLVVAGVWFVADGATRMRYDSPRERPAFLSGIDDDSAEAMRRMGTLQVVYRQVESADGPVSAPELASALELTEGRVGDALTFLEETGKVTRDGDRYSTVPPRWGKLDPVVRFAVWIPRRLTRPFRRVATRTRN